MADVAKYPPVGHQGAGVRQRAGAARLRQYSELAPGEGFPGVETAREQGRPEIDPGIIIAGLQLDRSARFCDTAFNVQSLGAPRTLAGVAC